MDILIIFFIIAINIFALFIATNFMKNMERKAKISICLLSTIILFMITTIMFALATRNISDIEVVNTSKWYMIGTMLSVNILIVLPYLSAQLLKYKQDTIDDTVLRNRMIALIVVFVIALGFEYKYMIQSQNRIIEIKHDIDRQIGE